MEPGMNAQLYTLRDVTRLPTGGRAKFLRTTGGLGLLRIRIATNEEEEEWRPRPATKCY
jgi:hypothetical protein